MLLAGALPGVLPLRGAGVTHGLHLQLLAAMAASVPRFTLSVACIHSEAHLAEAAARRHGATFVPCAPGVALPEGLYDCVLLAEHAERVLGDEGELDDVLAHLSNLGMIICLVSAQFADELTTEARQNIARTGLVALRGLTFDDAWGGIVFARGNYDPFVHARSLAGAGAPIRAVAVFEFLETCTPLDQRQRATVALEKLQCLRQVIASEEDAGRHAPLFRAQKEFHLAVHEWPRAPRAYLDQAANWRRSGNDDYAARLLRSLHHVTGDRTVLEAIADCDPGSTRQPPSETAPEWSGRKRAPRVLVLSHDCSDYGMDTLYDGLCRVLGADRVVEFPWKPTLHGQDKDAAVSYPCWFEYAGEPRSEDELVDALRGGQFDLIVYADFVQMNRKGIVLRMLDAAPDVPVVVYDPWDDGCTTLAAAREYLGGRAIGAYFKREMLACLDYGPNAYPLPFGYPDQHVPEIVCAERTTDLFWAGKRLFGTRSLYLDYLGEVLGYSLDQKLTQEAYRRAISEARIGLSFFGFGFDTVRYWELAAHGCMILAERPLIRIPHNFVEGETAVFFDDLPELERKLAYYMAHPDEAERIGRAGREHFLRYHTSSARARQFLGRIEHLLTD